MGIDDPRRDSDVEFLGSDAKRRVIGILGARRRRWLVALLAVAVLAAAGVTIVHSSGKPSGSPVNHAISTARSAIASGSAPLSSAPSTPPVTVIQLGAPLLGVRAGWQLFGRGDGMVVRIDMARGRITRSSVPALLSTGPVSFVVGGQWALVRPIDFVPGYMIADGQPAGTLGGALGRGGPAFPGPDPDHVWVPTSGNEPNYVLAGVDGQPTGVTIPIPRGASPLDAVSDQAGYLLFATSAGAYDARPDHTGRVTPGTVLAVGPTRWLTSECGVGTQCTTVLIDRVSGGRHVLDARVGGLNGQPGVISPDGAVAALPVRSTVEIVDLVNGTTHALSPSIDPVAADGGESLVWSPDGRWLFVPDANGHLDAVDARTGQVADLTEATGHALHGLTQLAVRAAGQ